MIFLILRAIGTGILGGVLLFAVSLLFSRLFFFLLFTGVVVWLFTRRRNRRKDNYTPLQPKKYDTAADEKRLTIVPFNPQVKLQK